MRQQIGRGLTLVLLAGIAFFYPLLAPRLHRIDAAHCQLINEGMFEEDIVSVFGAVAGTYDGVVPSKIPRGPEERVWASRSGTFKIVLDSDSGRVVSKEVSSYSYPCSTWERFRFWFHSVFR